jgi:SpoIIAA-like
MESKDPPKPSGYIKLVPHDAYMEVVISGSQTRETMHNATIETELAAREFTANNKPVHVLVQLDDIDYKPNLGAFQEAIKSFHKISFNRLAIYGELSKMVMTLVDTAISSFSSEFEMKYFSTREEAIVWLNA